MEHVRRIAVEPHPMGSEANIRVRGYIVIELAKLGLSPRISTATADVRFRNPDRTAGERLENVFVRIPGTANTGAVMIVSHYDSVPMGPGAGDAGAAVAAMLETARALAVGPALQNDVFFLFTDGEEGNLLGAREFAARHPRRGEPGIVLNFEGRGNAGPAYMFETSEGNAWMIREFAAAAPRPVASSVMAEIYRRMPNDTDLTIFMAAGLDGLNFAFVDGSTAYHTDLDTPENLSEASLMHHGSYMLALARRFGEYDFAGKGEEELVYFDLAGRTLVHYPESWNWPLAGGLLVLAALVLWLSTRRGLQHPKAVVSAAALTLVAVFTSALLVWGLSKILIAAAGDGLRLPVGSTTGDPWFFAAFALGALAIVAGLTQTFAVRCGEVNLAIGALLWWILLLLVAVVAMPGATFLLQWPAAAALLGLLLRLLLAGDAEATPLATTAFTICAAGAVLLLAPLVYGFFVCLGLRGAFLVAAIAALSGSLLVPVFAATRTAKPGPAILFTVATAVCLLVGLAKV